jgi:hypothetical protein
VSSIGTQNFPLISWRKFDTMVCIKHV